MDIISGKKKNEIGCLPIGKPYRTYIHLKHDLFSRCSSEKLIPGQNQAKNHDLLLSTPYAFYLFLDLVYCLGPPVQCK